ncbi:MAG: 50S ribosomal protein L10 [Firmicutes bacterium]|nr:50S ribosomal protein L10 [Candidatus Colimorpha enterica]
MPSAKILEQKKVATDELTEKVKSSVSGVVVSYAGITVADDTALRKALREAGVDYKVYKNTMTARACEAAGLAGIKDFLGGMTAFALSEKDAVAPAKILKQYAEKIESFEIRGGFVDGEILDQSKVMELANIPNKETLVCKVMLGMQNPLYKLAYALQAIIDKSGEAPAEEAPAAEAAAE